MSNYGASTPTSATAIAFLIQKLERYNCALSSEDRFKILSDIFDYTEEKLAEKNVDALCGFLKALREQCVVYNVVFENAAIIAVLRGCFRIREHSPDWVLLRERNIDPVFAFSVRKTEEQAQADGSVRKVAVFRHVGWIPAL